MSSAAVSSSSIYQELQAYFQQRTSDVKQLGQDLSAGNLGSAQQDFATLQSLGQGGPFANGDVFAPTNQREQDYGAIGQALQAGDLSSAQQAFAQLASTFQGKGGGGSESAATSALTPISTSSSSSTGSIYQQVREYYQQRKADIKQLGQDLSSGNIANAQQDISALTALGQGGPFKSGNPFNKSGREQDFAAIGQALQSGDLAGAQQAFAELEATFQKHQTSPPAFNPAPTTTAAQTSTLDTTA